MLKYIRSFACVLATMLVLSACGTVGDVFDGDDPAPLEGERISVLELEQTLEPDNAIVEAKGLSLPEPWTNQFWPQAGGYPNHAMHNPALGGPELKRIWRSDIGAGRMDEIPLTAQPILVDGVIYTLDTQHVISAFSAQDGDLIWRQNIKKDGEDEAVIGGGLAFADGALYATNGFNEVVSLLPASGEILWRKSVPTPVRAAPTVIGGRIFVMTLDNRLQALDALNGTLLWEYAGLDESASLVGAASPAANTDIVVPVFSSGEISALRVENGVQTWSDNLSNVRRFGSMGDLSDIRAMPVLDKNLVFALSFSGRMVAIDARSGVRVWQREISGADMPWVAGDFIFVLSRDNQLAALTREQGAIAWVTDLNRTGEDDDRQFYTGPVMAGGRLFVTRNDGRILEFNPEDGSYLRDWSAGHAISLPPIVAAETLYILRDDGILQAYR